MFWKAFARVNPMVHDEAIHGSVFVIEILKLWILKAF